MNAAELIATPHAGTSHDFDFIFGHWRVHHRRLRERLAGCTEWEVFDGVSIAQPLLGGQGTLDDNIINLPQGSYRAATMRAFDPATRQWSIWWLDGRYPRQVDVPMVGRFEGGEGVFYADETLRGMAIKVRFLWLRTATPSPRWEQAFSPDGGKTWETNWEMDFERLA
ncbi:DUF1579 domain-containing protein [Ideonella sp.]|uniref:DUF1579 domain-containing protein n=1 Tax=Ideonella sp. TaxID=1929293 RepID=UPI002B49F01A|nr:DUF1579 domain-containing protein [Ideonella sp.]HJV70959.1 DUF1579 domain-containing protein [Ideonella sp.]